MSYVVIKTATGTYTVVDVRRVFENFEADLRMLARRTGTMGQDEAEKTASDVLRFASEDYLTAVHVVLFDASGRRLRMKRYRVSTDAGGWDTQRPGGNAWPSPPGGSLRVIVSYSSKWHDLSEDAKSAFKSGGHYWWSSSTVDTSENGLSRLGSRRYSSNGYGLECDDFGRTA